MFFNEDTFYHIYNRGINKQDIFFSKENYLFFVSKLKKLIAPHCSILAYCLMPNHFHLLIYMSKHNTGFISSGQMQTLVRKLGTLQSSYTRAINLQENRSGSLFQGKFKAVELSSEHATTCFHYIHQNPVKAKLTNALEKWGFSSYREYIGNSIFQLCDKTTAYKHLNIAEDIELFKNDSLNVIINENVINILTTNKSSDH